MVTCVVEDHVLNKSKGALQRLRREELQTVHSWRSEDLQVSVGLMDGHFQYDSQVVLETWSL